MKSSAKNVELASVDDLFSTEESRADEQREKVVEIPLTELHPFKNHPFKVKDDEAMMDTAESIRQYKTMLGTDPRGNLIRIDNALAQMPGCLVSVQAQLDNLYQQQEAARAEVGKSFPHKQELREKSARLAALDMALNIDGRGCSQPEQSSIIAHATYDISAARIEGINNKIKTLRRQGYGYPDDEYFFLKLFDMSRRAYERNPKSHKICD